MLTGAVNQDVWSLRQPRLHRRPGVDRHDQHGARRSARELRRRLQHAPATRRPRTPPARTRCTRSSRAAAATSAPARTARILTTGAARDRAHGGQRGPATAAAASSTGTTRGGAASIVTGAYPAATRDRRPADVVHHGAGDDHRRRPAARTRTSSRPACGRLDTPSASAPGAAIIAHGTNAAAPRALVAVRQQPALPRRSRARVAEPGRSGLLGRPVATSGESGPAKRLGHSFYPKFVPLLLSLLPSTVRLTRGRDIQAACGQLAAER